jgi:hypothetical protein
VEVERLDLTGAPGRSLTLSRLTRCDARASHLTTQAGAAPARPDPTTKTSLEWELGIVAGFALVVAVLVTVAWVASLVDERRSGGSSPRDMTTVASVEARGERRPRRKRPLDGKNMTFRELTEELGLKKASLGVYSAEGWHERFGWNDRSERRGRAAQGGR